MDVKMLIVQYWALMNLFIRCVLGAGNHQPPCEKDFWFDPELQKCRENRLICRNRLTFTFVRYNTSTHECVYGHVRRKPKKFPVPHAIEQTTERIYPETHTTKTPAVRQRTVLNIAIPGNLIMVCGDNKNIYNIKTHECKNGRLVPLNIESGNPLTTGIPLNISNSSPRHLGITSFGITLLFTCVFFLIVISYLS